MVNITNRVIKSFILSISILLLLPSVHAQTKPMFSQYMFNMLSINPAYAGNRNSLNVSGVYRKQWVGIPGAPSTGMVSVDSKLNNTNWGLGGQVYNDQVGIEKSTGFQGYATYHIPLVYNGEDIYGEGADPLTLSVGMGFGIMNYVADYTKVMTIQPGDQSFMRRINGWEPTAGTGLLLHCRQWYIGLSAPSLLRAKVLNDNKTDVSSLLAYNDLFFTGGYIFGNEGDAIRWKPSLLIKMASGAPVQYDFNMTAWFNNVFSTGLSYRTGDAFVGMLELQLNPQLRMGYAYDYTISQLNIYSKGTHELMLRYEIGSGGKGVAVPIRYY